MEELIVNKNDQSYNYFPSQLLKTRQKFSWKDLKIIRKELDKLNLNI